jgi:hypothetical protein
MHSLSIEKPGIYKLAIHPIETGSSTCDLKCVCTDSDWKADYTHTTAGQGFSSAIYGDAYL